MLSPYFGRFEEHRPRWRRLLKSLLGVVMVVGTTAWVGRGCASRLIRVQLNRGVRHPSRLSPIE
jgi:hypothetical protein